MTPAGSFSNVAAIELYGVAVGSSGDVGAPRKGLWGKAKGANDAKGALLKALEEKKNGSQSPRHGSPGKRRPEAVVKRQFLSKDEKYCIMSGVLKACVPSICI